MLLEAFWNIWTENCLDHFKLVTSQWKKKKKKGLAALKLYDIAENWNLGGGR